MLTVITCAYKPRRAYLKAVLQALNGQTLDKSLWEYILIDNAGEPDFTTQFDLSWHPNARHVFEAHVGLTPARLRGIHESRGDLIVFVDDDNVLEADFLERAVEIAMEMPHIGAWSGHIAPVFETPPPDWTRPYWGNLAIRQILRDEWSNLPHLPETMPCGAGLCARRPVCEFYARLHHDGRRGILMDRTGTSLLSAGDNDLAACATDIGLGVGVFARLKLKHLMPPGRVEEDYLVRLTEGIAYSSVVFRSFRTPEDAVRGPGNARQIFDMIRLATMRRGPRRIQAAWLRGLRQARRDLLAAGRVERL